MEDCFSFIVDTGCSCSCSPIKEDFKQLVKLPTPITLKGITGEVICKYGRTIKVEIINEKGHIVTVETPGHCNPDQAVRLFSPQAHFWLMPKKEGTFCMSWAKTFLYLPGMGKLPLAIDQTSFMPLLTCFHDANKVVKQMANSCVTDDTN